MQIITRNHGDSFDRTSKGSCYNQHIVAREITGNTNRIPLESEIHPVSIKWKYFFQASTKIISTD